jgi:hypothetical protein
LSLPGEDVVVCSVELFVSGFQMRHDLISKTVCNLVEPAVRSVADRLFVLTGGRKGSEKHKPTIERIYETALVKALYEFMLMSPDLAHLDIRHEMKSPATTRPEQVDIWIRLPKGGRAHIIECGDFTPGKLKSDAAKMRRLNKKGINWFLAFFRDQPDPTNPAAEADSKAPWDKLDKCRRRKDSLKGLRIDTDKRCTKSFVIELPGQKIFFGFSLIRIKRIKTK